VCVCETSCFAEFIGLAKRSASCAFPKARPCDLSSPRENRGEGQTDGVKRSLGGKGFGDSTNVPMFCPFRPSMGAQTFRPSAVLPFCPFRFMVSSADGALPSVDSSPNAISLDLSLGQYSHTLEHGVASEKTGQSSIPDSGQQKAMGIFFGECRFHSSKRRCCVPLVSEDLGSEMPSDMTSP